MVREPDAPVSASTAERVEVVVIGAGPAGLAVGGALAARGVRARLLDREGVAAAWHRHYDRLHLHTVRSLSGLPGRPIPRQSGRYVARADVVGYLEEYRRANDLDVREGVAVERVERAGGGYRVVTPDGSFEAGAVVVATGYNRTPLLPDWVDADTFAGDIVHSAAYRNASPFAGRDVLVVGCGNSGAEIACDLAEHGARTIRVAIRTPPHVVPRQALGLPAQVVGIALARLPATVGDVITRLIARMFIGDLTRHGLARPHDGLVSRHRRRRAVPVLDVGFARAVKTGRISIVPGVAGLDGEDVVLDGGGRIRVDAIVAATGYRRGLEPLVAGLDGVLDPDGGPRVHGGDTVPGLPRLHFIGYTNDLGGNLRSIKGEAEAIAAALAP
jgi:cation diffusion facilitator CzcD-associated flavoprotein CzcO